jgi:hypothetical protein
MSLRKLLLPCRRCRVHRAVFRARPRPFFQPRRAEARSRRRWMPIARPIPWLTAAIFFAVYVAVTALSLARRGDHDARRWCSIRPALGHGAGFLRLEPGRDAGLPSRALPRCATGSRRASARGWRPSIAAWRRDGGFYLFTLRLVPAFPFFMINLVMGLTPMRTWTFYWVSQVGMFAGTIVYVNAGTQLAGIDSLRGILSPALIGSFALLGIFPLIAKKIVDGVKAKKVYARWTKPAKLRSQRRRHRRRQRRAWSPPTSPRRSRPR